MDSKAWRHPATWLALLALLVALGGSAYAANANKIDGKDLKKRSVPGNRLQPGAVTGTEVADGSLTGADLADGSVHGADLAPGTLPSPGLQPGSVQLSDLTPAARTALAENVPAGALLTGPARLAVNASSPTDDYYVAAGSMDYGGRRMPTTMTPEFVDLGAPPTAHCPGSPQAPDADPGYLCIYVTDVQGAFALSVVEAEDALGAGRIYRFDTQATIVEGDGVVGRSGAQLFLSPAASNVHSVQLVWAARAAGG